MAAPDRVYRYFTNLKSKNTTDLFHIRTAKPLASYITVTPATPQQQVEQLKALFKVDGILWIKNPDVPKQITDVDKTVTIEDPEHSGQTITIEDPDLGDPDRDGFIAYVYPSGANGAFHDIETNAKGEGVSGATDYYSRIWSRASKFRYKKNNDSEAAIILNDAGLNRRGEATVTAVDCSVDLAEAILYYCGSLIAPSYNRLYKCGIYYKWQSYNAIDSQTKDLSKAIYPPNSERKVINNLTVPKGTTRVLSSSTPLECALYQTDLDFSESYNLKAKDWIFFRPFVINEEGEYSYPYNENWAVRVPAIKWKVKKGAASTQVLFFRELDSDASSGNPFTIERAALVPDDNEENEGTGYGTMYLDKRLPDNESGITALVYNSGSLNSFYFDLPNSTSTTPIYYFGGLHEGADGALYYKWGLLNYGTVSQVSGAKYISQTNLYAPKIKITDVYTLSYKRSSVDNTLEYLVIDYYNSTLQTLMDGTTSTHGYVAPQGKTWVTPNGTNDTQVVDCIEEFNANFLSAIDDAGHHNHSDKTDIFAEEGVSAWGCASIEGMVGNIGTSSSLYTSIYKNTNQVNDMDGISAEDIRDNGRYIYEQPSYTHLFTGAVVSFKMVENPNTGIDEAKGYYITIYVLGKNKGDFSSPYDSTNGYTFVSDYSSHQ